MNRNISIPSSLYRAIVTRAKGSFTLLQHAKQEAFTSDPARLKAACCSRRAGKSTGTALDLYNAMEAMPGELSAFVALTVGEARRLLWTQGLERFQRALDLPIQLKTIDGKPHVVHENGAQILLSGCSHQREIGKLRGPRYYKVVIDEAQTFGEYLEDLVHEVFEPALADLSDQGSQLCLTGTPGATSIGFFHDVTQRIKPGWSVHHWTVLDNTLFPTDPQKYLDEALKRHGWTVDTPTFVREYRGIWCDDAGSLIYPFERARNGWSPGFDRDGTACHYGPFGLPPGSYRHGIGIDLGFGENSTAFVHAAVRDGMQEAYLLRGYTRSRLTPLDLTAHVEQLQHQITQECGESAVVVVDEGALGAGYAEQMRQLGVGCIAATKVKKRTYQDFAKGLIVSGGLQVDYSKCSELVAEAARLPFDPETGQEDKRYRNHCCDAMLYVVRQLLPSYDPEENQPRPGTPEAIKLEMQRYKERLRLKEKKKREGGWRSSLPLAA